MRPFLFTLLAGLLYLVILFWKQFLGFSGLYQDENHYLPTAIEFSRDFIPSLELLKTYHQLNTPLPFILGGWVIRLFGEDIRYLRLMNYVLSFVVLQLFIWYKPSQSPKYWASLIPLLAMPSFYLCSIHYYTDMVAWVSVLLGVMAYLNQRHLVASIAFVAAIASRQYMLAFPAAIVSFEVVKILESERPAWKNFLPLLLRNKVWMGYAVSVLSLIPWILLWGGLAPEAIMKAQHYGNAPFYNPGFVLYMSAIAAFYYVIPETLILGRWAYFRDYPAKYPFLFGSLVLFVAGVSALFPPVQTYNEYFTWPYLGYLDQMMGVLGLPPFIKYVFFGILSLVTLMRFIQPGSLSLGTCFVFVNLLLLGKAQLSWDKYLFPVILVMWFMTMHQENRLIRFRKL